MRKISDIIPALEYIFIYRDKNNIKQLGLTSGEVQEQFSMGWNSERWPNSVGWQKIDAPERS